MAVEGGTAKVTGKAKKITEPWKEFDSSGNNTGHFVPITMPSVCVGKKVAIKGRKAGKRTVNITEDRLLIVRLENLSGNTMTVELDGSTLLAIDFSGLIREE